MANDTQSSEAKEIARKKNLIAISGAMIVSPAGVITYQIGALFGGYLFGTAIAVGTVVMVAGIMLFIQTQLETTVSNIEVMVREG